MPFFYQCISTSHFITVFKIIINKLYIYIYIWKLCQYLSQPSVKEELREEAN